MISGRKARKTEVTQSRFEQREYLFTNVEWRRLKKYTSRSGFLFCSSRCWERDISTRLLKWRRIDDILAEDNINAASWFPSQTWPARQRGRGRRRWNISGSLFSVAACTRLTLNSPRNVTKRRRCGNSVAIRRQKNRTYHNGMRSDCWNITAVFWRSIDRFPYRDSAFAPCGGIASLERPSSSLYLHIRETHSW